jgi:hypothetical protein
LFTVCVDFFFWVLMCEIVVEFVTQMERKCLIWRLV